MDSSISEFATIVSDCGSSHTSVTGLWTVYLLIITKTRLFKFIENFTSKNGKFSDKSSDIFIFPLKTYIVGTR